MINAKMNFFWLGGRDSNPGSQLQRLVSYQLDDPRMPFAGQKKLTTGRLQ